MSCKRVQQQWPRPAYLGAQGRCLLLSPRQAGTKLLFLPLGGLQGTTSSICLSREALLRGTCLCLLSRSSTSGFSGLLLCFTPGQGQDSELYV